MKGGLILLSRLPGCWQVIITTSPLSLDLDRCPLASPAFTAKTSLPSRRQPLAEMNTATRWWARDASIEPICLRDAGQGRMSVALAGPCLCVLDDGMEQARDDSQPNFESINAHLPVAPATIRAKPSGRAKSDHSRLAKNTEHVQSPLALRNKARRIAESGICSAFP